MLLGKKEKKKQELLNYTHVAISNDCSTDEERKKRGVYFVFIEVYFFV